MPTPKMHHVLATWLARSTMSPSKQQQQQQVTDNNAPFVRWLVDNHKVFQLMLYATGVFVSFFLYDYLMELLFHMEGYTFGFFAAIFLQFGASVGSLIAMHTCDQQTDVFASRTPGQLQHNISITNSSSSSGGNYTGRGFLGNARTAYYYVAIATLLVVNNGMGTAALAMVSLPVKVIFKSSKLIPTMVIGILFGRHYSWFQYVAAVLFCVGLVSFSLADARANNVMFKIKGVILLCCSVTADALIPNTQEFLINGLNQSKQKVAFHSNWMSGAMTLLFTLATGEFVAAIAYVTENPKALAVLLCTSVIGYTGIVSFLFLVQSFGAKNTVIVTSTRKVFTILVSILQYGKPFSSLHGLGLLSMTLGVILTIKYKK